MLLTGSDGQVGWELARSLLPLGQLFALNRAQVDFTDLDKLRALIRAQRPDVIVNAAAYTAVDKAESDFDLAYKVNAEAPAILAEEAKNNGALLIHFSTDYIFDGTKTTAYTEQDLPNPLNVYGQSKLAGEQAIQALASDYLIFRTTWVFAARGKNFLQTIIRLASERETLNIVADQIGSPTWARLIAETAAHALRQSMQERQQDQFNSAIYNLTATGSASWFDFSKAIVEKMRQNEQLKLMNRIINPIKTEDYPLPARRPANSRLAINALEQHFGLQMPTWQATLNLCMDEIFNSF